MSAEDIVIVGARRTPIGSFGGSLKSQASPVLGSVAMRAALSDAGVASDQIAEVIMGCVLPAGVGQAPARQAALAAGLTQSTPCITLNKVCGSGMKAVMLAQDALQLGRIDIALAGGMESMSRAPYLMPGARDGYRMGHQQVQDHMLLDGLEDAYGGGLMGVLAQKTADQYGLTREGMDQFAIHSVERARATIDSGAFEAEIAAVDIQSRRESVTVTTDEGPQKASPEKIPQLRPAFDPKGTLTAANSSSISDGAAALVLMRGSVAEKTGAKPLARIVAQATHARAPEEFTIAPIGAIEKVLKQSGWSAADVDLFEINEAFAMVTMLAQQELGLDPQKVNCHGGACALGHPIGASGARILVTLIHALRQQGKKRGVAALCIGGGEATALAVECL